MKSTKPKPAAKPKAAPASKTTPTADPASIYDSISIDYPAGCVAWVVRGGDVAPTIVPGDVLVCGPALALDGDMSHLAGTAVLVRRDGDAPLTAGGGAVRLVHRGRGREVLYVTGPAYEAPEDVQRDELRPIVELREVLEVRRRFRPWSCLERFAPPPVVSDRATGFARVAQVWPLMGDAERDTLREINESLCDVRLDPGIGDVLAGIGGLWSRLDSGKRSLLVRVAESLGAIGVLRSIDGTDSINNRGDERDIAAALERLECAAVVRVVLAT